MALARDPSRDSLELASELLANARPTAVNLAWAVDRVRAAAAGARIRRGARRRRAGRGAARSRPRSVAASDAIARHGADCCAAPGGS